MEQMLSRPPQATKLPEGAYAQVITQLDRRGMAWICRDERVGEGKRGEGRREGGRGKKGDKT